MDVAVRAARVALVGNPNCGKTALFNALTGSRQKVANYAGVTVERKLGTARFSDGRSISVIDLPGTYSLRPATPDEQVTLDVIEGRRAGEAAPDAIVAVVDATNLRMTLRLGLELKRLGELGFLPGEPVQLVRRGPGGREPLAVLIGDTMLALRLLEARCVEVTPA